MAAKNAYNSVPYNSVEREEIGQLEKGIPGARLEKLKLYAHGTVTQSNPFILYDASKENYNRKFKDEYIKLLFYERIDERKPYNIEEARIEREYLDFLQSLYMKRSAAPPSSKASTAASGASATGASATGASATSGASSATGATEPTMYRRLKVPIHANQNTIKRQYKKLALKYHPDKGGDVEKFKRLGEAYSILSNTTKRQQYNANVRRGIRKGGRRHHTRTMKRTKH